MANTNDVVTLEVATPQGLVLRTEATSVQAPSVGGEFGVLPGHLPLLAALRAGLLRYTVDGENHVAAVGDGFVEAGPGKVLLLTRKFSTPEDVKADTVREELTTAETALGAFDEFYEGPEYYELQRKIDWAQARLDARATIEN